MGLSSAVLASICIGTLFFEPLNVHVQCCHCCSSWIDWNFGNVVPSLVVYVLIYFRLESQQRLRSKRFVTIDELRFQPLEPFIERISSLAFRSNSNLVLPDAFRSRSENLDSVSSSSSSSFLFASSSRCCCFSS